MQNLCFSYCKNVRLSDRLSHPVSKRRRPKTPNFHRQFPEWLHSFKIRKAFSKIRKGRRNKIRWNENRQMAERHINILQRCLQMMFVSFRACSWRSNGRRETTGVSVTSCLCSRQLSVSPRRTTWLPSLTGLRHWSTRFISSSWSWTTWTTHCWHRQSSTTANSEPARTRPARAIYCSPSVALNGRPTCVFAVISSRGDTSTNLPTASDGTFGFESLLPTQRTRLLRRLRLGVTAERRASVCTCVTVTRRTRTRAAT